MGRHRRGAAESAATGRAPEAAGAYTTAPGAPERAGGSHRRAKRAGVPVRTGLLGVSAAVAMGTVAVASGLLPGGDGYSVSGGTADKVRAADSPSALESQGGTANRDADRAARGSERPDAPEPSPSLTADRSDEPTRKPSSDTPSADASEGKESAGTSKESSAPAPEKSAKPTRSAPAAPPKPAPSEESQSAESATAAAVLSLVNQERATAGCSPVTADAELAALAGSFSSDMAARGFFDHTDPDGATPWDRAEQAGVSGLGGENIARGQANAQSVMDSWMNSPGHRANILNCDYKTLGVGVHFGDGGPWWTQDFGF